MREINSSKLEPPGRLFSGPKREFNFSIGVIMTVLQHQLNLHLLAEAKLDQIPFGPPGEGCVGVFGEARELMFRLGENMLEKLYQRKFLSQAAVAALLLAQSRSSRQFSAASTSSCDFFSS